MMTNERIEQIMAQAGFDPAAIQRMGVMPNAEKFAELIVSDVVAKIQSVGYKSSNDIPFEVTDLFVSQIKEHFGVRE